MPSRRALIVDRDKTYAQRLDRCLRLLDFDVDIVETRREALESLKVEDAAIVLIAVERPKKTGFKVFTDVKRLVRNVPIVLASSTVPMAELLMHQKLRLHADAYVDKRDTTDREVLDTLNGLLRLKLDSDELSALDRQARSGRALPGRARDVGTDAGGAVTEQSDEAPAVADLALADLLGDVDVSPVIVESSDLDSADVSEEQEEDGFEDVDEEIASLQEEVRQLQRELEHARRSASSSPFSTDYLELSERADAEEQANARTRRELGARTRQVESLRTKLLQVAGRLLDAERLRDQSVNQLRDLEARIGPLEGELRLSRERMEDLTHRLEAENGRREALDRQHESAIMLVETRLADEKRRAVEARQRLRLELTTLEQRHQTVLAEAVERERRQQDQQRGQLKREHESAALAKTEAQREERAAAVKATDAKWQLQLDELRQRQELELEARQEERRKELAELQGSMEQALLRKDREMQRAMADAAAGQQVQEQQAYDFEEKASELRREHSQALEAKDVELQTHVESLRQEHVRAIEARSDEHRGQIDELIASYEQALGDKDRQHEEAIEQAVAEARQEYVREAGERLNELELAETNHRANLAEVERRSKDQIELLDKLHEEELDQLRSQHDRACDRMRAEHDAVIAGLEEKILAEQKQTVAAQQAEWQAKLEEMRREQAQNMATEREEMQVIIDALETVKGVDRPESLSDETPVEPASAGGATARNSVLLREIAEEMDRLGRSVSDAADENADPGSPSTAGLPTD
jgi:hypothetical protein